MHRRSFMKFVISLFTIGLAIVPVMLTLLADPVSGTTTHMAKLPSAQRFQCLICHTTVSPVVGASELNPFGVDFQKNGNIWDRDLALLNSDGDKCANGFELGDMDGNGFLDAGIDEENSNPGNPKDCSIALSEQTWGKIKELFGGK